MKRLEKVLGQELELWPTDKEEVFLLRDLVDEAGRLTVNELKDHGKTKRKHRGYDGDDKDRDDDVVEAGMPVTKY